MSSLIWDKGDKMTDGKIYEGEVVGADVGGTNVTLSVIMFENGVPDVVFSERKDTAAISRFSDLLNQFLKSAGKQGLKPREGCFAVAGRVEYVGGAQRVTMTNADLIVDSADIQSETSLQNVLIINDFEAISYATNVLKPDQFITLNKGKAKAKATRAVVGAGTGLGKSILRFYSRPGSYLPLPSEGGHSDLPLLNSEELRLSDFIREEAGIRSQLSYEDVLSGRGLERIYQYLCKTRFTNQPAVLSAKVIAQTAVTNPCSRETFSWFIKFYARCARNFVLDSLATGGLFIAGGIAAKNPDFFQDFMEEFIKNETYRSLLKDVPVQLITDYFVSPAGAAYALAMQKKMGDQGGG
jgi:glucokinase